MLGLLNSAECLLRFRPSSDFHFLKFIPKRLFYAEGGKAIASAQGGVGIKGRGPSKEQGSMTYTDEAGEKINVTIDKSGQMKRTVVGKEKEEEDED